VAGAGRTCHQVADRSAAGSCNRTPGRSRVVGESGGRRGEAPTPFSIVAADGKRVLFRGPEQADLRDQENVFAVAEDGHSVRFGLEQWGKHPVRFDLAERRVEVDAPEDRALTVARTQAAGLEITDWQNTREPKLAGKPLALKQYERSRSVAIAPDGKRFALGNDWSLRLFDAQGAEVWQKQVPDAAWRVNVTGDGRLVVSGYGVSQTNGGQRTFHVDGLMMHCMRQPAAPMRTQ
jgi:hypothetical protein